MPRFASGVVRFQNEVYPQREDLFERLSKGQSPEALFITCSDSRIDTGMITQSAPGELFISRNAGNIVPPHADVACSVASAIEFAVAGLEVPHIVICGHTGCGAMAGAMDPEKIKALPQISKWIAHSQAAVEKVREHAGDLAEAEQLHLLTEQNVLLQLAHLQTHPSVAERLKQENIQLHGWVYHIKTGAVDAYDPEQNEFVPVTQHYAEAIAEHLSNS